MEREWLCCLSQCPTSTSPPLPQRPDGLTPAPCTPQRDSEMASPSLSALVRTLSFLPPELGENCTKTLSLSHHCICVPSSSFFVLSNYSLPPSFSLLLHFLDEDTDTKRSEMVSLRLTKHSRGSQEATCNTTLLLKLDLDLAALTSHFSCGGCHNGPANSIWPLGSCVFLEITW